MERCGYVKMHSFLVPAGAAQYACDTKAAPPDVAGELPDPLHTLTTTRAVVFVERGIDFVEATDHHGPLYSCPGAIALRPPLLPLANSHGDQRRDDCECEQDTQHGSALEGLTTQTLQGVVELLMGADEYENISCSEGFVGFRIGDRLAVAHDCNDGGSGFLSQT